MYLRTHNTRTHTCKPGLLIGFASGHGSGLLHGKPAKPLTYISYILSVFPLQGFSALSVYVHVQYTDICIANKHISEDLERVA